MCFIPDNYPRLIEAYSDGKDSGSPLYRPEFTTNGMFVVNSQKIEVAYDTGLNVLDYDPGTGRHNFMVLLSNFIPAKRTFSYTNERSSDTHGSCSFYLMLFLGFSSEL